MSVAEAYRLARRTGCAYGSPEEVKARLADIAAYLGTKDPIELGAALLLEQTGYERSQLQLASPAPGSSQASSRAARWAGAEHPRKEKETMREDDAARASFAGCPPERRDG